MPSGCAQRIPDLTPREGNTCLVLETPLRLARLLFVVNSFWRQPTKSRRTHNHRRPLPTTELLNRSHYSCRHADSIRHSQPDRGRHHVRFFCDSGQTCPIYEQETRTYERMRGKHRIGNLVSRCNDGNVHIYTPPGRSWEIHVAISTLRSALATRRNWLQGCHPVEASLQHIDASRRTFYIPSLSVACSEYTYLGALFRW